MSKTVLKFLFSLLLCLVSIECAKADVIWPTLIIYQGMCSIPYIIIGLIIEILFVKRYMKFDWIKSFWVGIVLNLISALIGYVALVLGGMFIFLCLSYVQAKLNILTHNFAYVILYGAPLIFCVIVNVLLEGLALKVLFKKQLTDTYKWLTYANILSVSVAIVYLAIVKPEMHF